MERRLAFFDKLKERRAIPYWNNDGRMTFVRAPENFDWDALQGRILSTDELPALSEDTDALAPENVGRVAQYSNASGATALRNAIAHGLDSSVTRKVTESLAGKAHTAMGESEAQRPARQRKRRKKK
jgi:hypothetical protein